MTVATVDVSTESDVISIGGEIDLENAVTVERRSWMWFPTGSRRCRLI